MVPCNADPAVDNASARMDKVDQTVKPRLCQQRRPAPVVEPEETDAVNIHQFSHLRQALFREIFFKSGIRRLFQRRVLRNFRPERQSSAGEFPVKPMRIICAEENPVTVAGVFQLPQKIASERSHPPDVIAGNAGIVQSKTVMVLACNDNIFHSGVLRFQHPFIRIEMLHRQS